jgi:hypothetical protein
MKADSFDWKKGRITFWDLDLLDREKHVSEQLERSWTWAGILHSIIKACSKSFW